ncbi:discoidin domain-containing protein [Paenibacillus nanensis]|nr:discoidin domain-containing protein [Paenibacillus nanensis]
MRNFIMILFSFCLLIACFHSSGWLLNAEKAEAAEGPNTANLLPQTNITLKQVSSEETQGEDGRAVNAFDGNPNTFWHSKYSSGTDAHPHTLDLGLGGTHEISGIRYLPRQTANSNGSVKSFEVYVSVDGVNWGEPAASGTFENSKDEKEVLFGEPVIANHLRFVALSEMNGQPFTTIAELNVLQTEANRELEKALKSDPESVSLEVGQTKQVHVSWLFGSEAKKDVTSVIRYTSLDPEVATVSNSGVITARDAGTTTIRMEHGDAAPARVTVQVTGGEANRDLTVTQEGSLVTIGNWHMARVFDTSNGKLRTLKLMNKRSGNTAEVQGGEEFILYLADNARLLASDLSLDGWDVRDEEDGGKTVTFRFQPKDQITVALVVNMKPNDHFMRKHLDIQSANEGLHLNRIELESLSVPGPFWSTPVTGREGFGQPVYANDLFFGVEFPGADNRLVNQKVVSAYAAGNPEAGAGRVITKTSVTGAAPSKEEIRAAFLAYVDTIALPPRFQLQYNGWFELYHDANSQSLLRTYKEIEKGMSSYGVRPLDIYAADDGWADWNRGFWDFNLATFPNEFRDQAELLKHYQSQFGVWLGPAGGYKSPGAFSSRLQREYGYETIGGYMDVTGPKYTQALKERMMALTDEFDIQYWKLDGFVMVDNAVTSEPSYFTRFWDTWIDIFKDLREHEKEIFLNITTGSNNSPWLLPYVNSIWLNIGTDAGYRGTGSDRDQMLTYVDDKYYTRFKVQQSQMPLRFIYNHEPVHGIYVKNPAGRDYTQTLEEFRKYLFMCLVRGTGFVEVYYSPSRFDDAQWTVNADALKWAENNFDALSQTDMIGGSPIAGDVYGYSGWTAEKGVVGLRNPSSQTKTYALKLDTLIGVKDRTKSYYRSTVYPYGAAQDGPYAYGDTITVTLEPYDAFVWQFETALDETSPEIVRARAASGSQLELIFNERVERAAAIHPANYSLNNGAAVESAVLGEDFKTVILTVSGLRQGVPYTLTVNHVQDMAGNVIAADTARELYRADDGLVAHWEFAEQSGGIAQDSSGNGNAAVIHDAERTVSEDANALRFNGVSSYVEAGTAASVTSAGDMAVSVRINTLSSQKQVIIQQGAPGAAAGYYQLSVNENGYVEWLMSDGATDAGFLAVSDTAVNDGQWHRIVAVREANGLGKIYVDGKLDGSGYTGTSVNLQPSDLYIGANGPGGPGQTQHFDGELADIRIFNRSLPYDEVESMDTDAPSFLAQENWSLHYTDSEHTAGEDGRAVNAFDGSPNTYWHTRYSPDAPMPHEIQIDLGETHELNGFVYTPRKQMNGSKFANGIVKDYEFYVSMDGERWGEPVASGMFAPDNTDKEVLFGSGVIGRYVRLVARSEIYGQAFTTAAELNVIQSKHNRLMKTMKASKPSVSLAPGESERLQVTWQLGSLSKLDLTEHAAYSSDNANIASVDDQGNITAVADGTTIIRIQYESLEPIFVPVTVTSGSPQHVKATLSGPDEAESGEQFEVKLGLRNVNRPVLAQDMTLRFDSSKINLEAADSLTGGVQIVESSLIAPGHIRFFVASTGEANAVVSDSEILELTFTANEVAESLSADINVTAITLAGRDGSEFAAEPAEISVTLTAANPGLTLDINGDGRVSIGDLAIAASYYGASAASPNWQEAKRANVNGDEQIDIADLALIARQLLQ